MLTRNLEILKSIYHNVLPILLNDKNMLEELYRLFESIREL